MCFGILSTCSTAPDFNRNNTKDPKSDYYVPELPENSPVSIALDNSRNIILSWDQKELQDGVIIAKKYQANSPFIALDTLYGEPLSYIDDSGIFISGTTYRLDFFRVLADSSLGFNRESALVTLKFAPFNNMHIYYEDRLEVTTKYGGSPQKGEIRYFDGLEVLVNTSNNSESPMWDTVGTVNHTEFSNGVFRTNITFKLFDLDIKINQFIADSSGNRIPLKSVSRRFYINSIDDISFEFIDELSGTVRWVNKVSFGDGYIIESNRTDTIYGAPKTSYHLSLTEAPQLPFEVSIKPFINENFGETRTTPYPIYLNIISPDIYEFNPLNNNSFEIAWRIHQDDQAAGYIIEQSKLPENTYTPIDTVSADQRSYIVLNLEQDHKYNFAVHSYTSEWSRYITIGYQNTFVPTQSVQLEVPGTNITFSKSGKYMAKHVPNNATSFGDDSIYVKNLTTGAEYLHEMPYYDNHHRPRIIDFVISETNNTIIYLGDNHSFDNSGEYISVYDFVNEKFIHEYKTMPGYGRFAISLLNDDESIAISKNDAIIIYDSMNDQIVSEIPSANNYNTVLRPHKDTAIKCSESGIFEYDLTTGDIVNQSNESCIRGSINESSNLLTFFSNSSIKVLDLDSYSTIKVINDERIDLNNIPFYFWYFEEDDLLIYPIDSGVYNGYEASRNIAFAFLLPSYNKDRLGQIQTIERESNGTYSIISFDGEFLLNYEESWSLIEKGPRRL